MECSSVILVSLDKFKVSLEALSRDLHSACALQCQPIVGTWEAGTLLCTCVKSPALHNKPNPNSSLGSHAFPWCVLPPFLLSLHLVVSESFLLNLFYLFSCFLSWERSGGRRGVEAEGQELLTQRQLH